MSAHIKHNPMAEQNVWENILLLPFALLPDQFKLELLFLVMLYTQSGLQMGIKKTYQTVASFKSATLSDILFI